MEISQLVKQLRQEYDALESDTRSDDIKVEAKAYTQRRGISSTLEVIENVPASTVEELLATLKKRYLAIWRKYDDEREDLGLTVEEIDEMNDYLLARTYIEKRVS